ncbi:MAG: sulfite exporter TauE/SafE family protein [Deltaproteobacteria bacterium]|nr:sulfite exporter TauE/SafE family protein [Deltaproteobacteria bacterium]
MMTLLWTTAIIALIHTLVGVDHYLPFVVLARAENWSLKRTLLWTAICGLGHIASSVAIAALAGGLGWTALRLSGIDAVRSDFAAYLLIGFGLLLVIVSIGRRRQHHHSHLHRHADGTVHSHPHHHRHPLVPKDAGAQLQQAHDDVPHKVGHRKLLWGLFVVFVLGPCEPLIPLLLAPSIQHNALGALAVLTVFSAVTLAAMLVAVTLGVLGLSRLRLRVLQGREHVLAGVAVMLSGVLILFGL